MGFKGRIAYGVQTLWRLLLGFRACSGFMASGFGALEPFLLFWGIGGSIELRRAFVKVASLRPHPTNPNPKLRTPTNPKL